MRPCKHRMSGKSLSWPLTLGDFDGKGLTINSHMEKLKNNKFLLQRKPDRWHTSHRCLQATQEDHQKSEGVLGQDETSNNSNSRRDWKVAQCLRGLTALVEDQDSDPSAHVRQLTPAEEDLVPSAGLLTHPRECTNAYGHE